MYILNITLCSCNLTGLSLVWMQVYPQILRFYFNFSAMLSDVPHDSEADIVSEPYDNINDCEEEPDFVPIGKSNLLVKISPLDGNHLV